MKKKTRSILEELNNIGLRRDADHLVEASGSNIIESAINLLNKINSTYDINSIKSSDPRKFKRSISKVIEAKRKSNNDT